MTPNNPEPGFAVSMWTQYVDAPVWGSDGGWPGRQLLFFFLDGNIR